MSFASDVKQAAPEMNGLPLVFSESFESGTERWRIFDPKTWRLRQRQGNTTFEITQRESEYKPAVRSPKHLALIKDVAVKDFVLEFKVRSTKDTGNHRDCCVFFCFQDPSNFYYVHLGARPDPASGQIMIVKDAPRAPLTDNKKRTPWDDKWHKVRVVYKAESGRIQIFFDDMKKPHMKVQDDTFSGGRVGIGSFDDCNEFDDVVLYGKRITEPD
ncbi:MAG: hypothetical protein MI725_01710 [Pirellulales bacterium]|nr:hypothetical protein [Pirellulales bacterium]